MYEHRSAWNDYFSGTSQPQVISQQTTRQTPTNQCVYILNCLFQSITATSDGGAVYCSSSVTYLLVESTSFFSCKTSSAYGGAIYFGNSNSGQSVLHTVCGNDCNSGTSYGQFLVISVYNNPLTKNYVNYSSFARCLNEQRNEILAIYNGRIYCPSVNLSMNKCYCYSGIYFIPYVDSNSVTCSLTYSSIKDNNATGYTCIRFSSSGPKYEMKSCNILRNTQVIIGTQGTIYANGNLMIEDSCILENEATYIFYQASTSYTITLSNCTVDKTSNNGYLTTQSTVTKGFIHKLKHMSTQNCHSEYDSAGRQTSIECYTRGKYLQQSSLRDFFVLTCVSFFALKLLPQ
jgi:hypothetical protein